jgi:hypothetical protein
MKLIIKYTIILLFITLVICNKYNFYDDENILKYINDNKNMIIYLIFIYLIYHSYNNTINENFDTTTPTPIANSSAEGSNITQSIFDLLINNTLNLPNNGISKIGTSSVNTNTDSIGNTTNTTNFIGSSLTSNNLSIGSSSTTNNTTTTTGSSLTKDNLIIGKSNTDVGSSLTKDTLTLSDNGKICFGTTCFGKSDIFSYIKKDKSYAIEVRGQCMWQDRGDIHSSDCNAADANINGRQQFIIRDRF